MDKSQFYFAGFLNDRREKELLTAPGARYFIRFDGIKLDELQIAATVKSKQDIIHLIHHLEIMKNCFEK